MNYIHYKQRTSKKERLPTGLVDNQPGSGGSGRGLLLEDGFGRDIPPGSFNPNHIRVEISSFSYFVSDKNWDKFWHIYYKNLCVII